MGIIPLSNLLMALLWALVAFSVVFLPHALALPLRIMARYGIEVNVFFMIFCLLPLPPFPGGLLMMTFLPYRYAKYLEKIEPYTLWILLALVMTNILPKIIIPIIRPIIALLTTWLPPL